ncbi:zinc-dependent peptidase [Tenacibaculum xiamenense]|uniref:zinc-dependent peptidase n=1 Tax=Tenacibaculum xiamenense TaxID=1261553 RepID=UPI00389641FF
MLTSTIAILFIGLIIYRRKTRKKITKHQTPITPFPANWRTYLIKNVAFYNSLTLNEKNLFEFKIQEFLLNCTIIGVDTSVEDIDEVLIASSAIIPIFNFPDWHYPNISEIFLYPCMFNRDLERTGPNRNILGMVGNGFLENKMILSKNALHLGFKNESDKQNTAIHEFIHLIDKLDGRIDGIPEVLLEKQYVLPWIDLMTYKMEEIYDEESDINPYGGTNKAEFFSVVGEYFFERPKLLAKKHPKLYNKLELIFKQDMDSRNLFIPRIDVGRNDPCPCNSGKKYKKCCGIN